MEGFLKQARKLAVEYYQKHLTVSAVFWSEKALLLSGGDLEDVVLYCQALYSNQEYRRVIHFLQSTTVNTLLDSCSGLRYLAAKCFAACKAWEEVIELLRRLQTDESEMQETKIEDTQTERLGNVTAASCILLGTAFEALGNVQEAVNCYKEALMEDVYCEEALDHLYNMHAFTASDEQSFLKMLPFKKQCTVEEERVLKYLYRTKLHYDTKENNKLPDSYSALASSIDVKSSDANASFINMNIRECFDQTKSILQQDPYHIPTLLLHIPCCAMNNSFKELYSLGHDLAKHFPTSPISWYAVSSYYYVIGKHTQARRYLTKSINLDPHFAPAHLAFGLSFASEGEHDQAIAAFSHAARYMRGSHIPLMYLGKEYYITGAVPISTSFFKNALSLAPRDPTLLQEIGMVLASAGNYDKAEKYFQRTITLLQTIDSHVTLQAWEPVYNNLGHVLRKQGKYPEALEAHMKALQLVPNEASTLSAISFIYLLMEDYSNVVQYCNQSLRIKRADQFTIDVLQIAVKELATLPLDLGPFSDHSLDQVVYEEPLKANVFSTFSGESAMQTD